MRSVSGVRNRIHLTLVAVACLLGAVWLAGGWFDLRDRWPALAHLLPGSDERWHALWAQRPGWLLPTLPVVAVLLVLHGVLMLVRQVPRRPVSTTLRIVDTDGTLLASVAPSVLEKALAGRLSAVPGVVDARVQVSGAASASRV